MKTITQIVWALFLQILFLYPLSAITQTIDDQSVLSGIWWTNNDILANQTQLPIDQKAPLASDIKRLYQDTKGVFATVRWKDIEPSNNNWSWGTLNTLLQSYKAEGFYTILMIWAGPDCPGWLLDPGPVPTIKTNDDGVIKTYPDYLFKDDQNFQPYKYYWYRMIDAVADHIINYADGVHKKVVIYQSAEGSTGDEGPYHGNVVSGNEISRTSAAWIQFRKDAWKHTYDLYKNVSPKIHLLVNCDPEDPEDNNQWVQNTIPNTWRKTSNAGHGYQLNEEQSIKDDFDYLINTPTPNNNSNATLIRCRDEMDQYSTPLFLTAPDWHIYWTALSALHFGLDMWCNNAAGIKDPDNNNKDAFKIFTKYAGYKNPKSSPSAFCALRDGLDASDFDRFKVNEPANDPQHLFGTGTSAIGDENGINRCKNIAYAYRDYGADQEDAPNAQGGSQNNKDATKMNDVGWHIFAGNYERYITQYDPVNTSVGWWRVGSKNKPYGRFARGFDRFDRVNNKLNMFFDINDAFVNGGTKTASGGYKVQIHIVYYDIGDGTWKLKYHSIDPLNPVKNCCNNT